MAAIKGQFSQTSQILCQYLVESVISEATYSQFFVEAHTNIFFQNWMLLNTVDLKLLLTINYIVSPYFR
jgi:hypothetical protein